LLHHHGHDRPLTEAEREKLLSEGAAAQGRVLANEPTAADRRISQVRVAVDFEDGQRVEFSEELANLYQPAPDGPEARRLAEVREAQQLRHPDRIPKIQLPLAAWERVPVRYDAVVQPLVACPGPAPLQFQVTYSANGHTGTSSLPGFPDLTAVHYGNCPAPSS
jgi:hypothetical protein